MLARPSRQGPFLKVIHEDRDLLVLDKLSGVPSVPHSSEETETAVGAALAYDPALSGVGRGELEPGILHRLDTGTSGLLAFARNEAAYLRLHEAWKSGRVRKIYRAIVSPEDADVEALRVPRELALTLAHDAKSSKRMRVIESGVTPKNRYRSKPLSTRTRLAKIHSRRDALLDLEIEIHTGVMHQIRCTLAHLGFPVLGDPVYKGGESARLWLHAWKLELPATDGSALRLEAPLPSDWPV